MNRTDLNSLLADGAVATPPARIVRALRERGALSATQISGITGLAKSTVSMTLTELRRSNLVIEAPNAETGRAATVGRPATAVTLNPEAGTCIGVTIGSNHVQVVLADVSHAVIIDNTEYLDPDYPPKTAAEVTRKMVRQAYNAAGLSPESLLGAGIAIAGPINPFDGKVIRASGVPTWAGIDIKSLFQPVFRCAIFADNESNCAAMAEMMWGAAVGCEDFVFFKIDLGVGGAIVSRGHIITGIAGAAGEFGHMSIDPNGELCRCGNRGCLELSASFVKPLELASRRFGRQMTIDEVTALARKGDGGCRRLIEDTAEAAGRGLGIIGSATNPGLIVVGGRLALAGELLIAPLAASYDKHALVKRIEVPPEARTRIVKGKLTENDSALGAVGLVLRHHGRLV